MMVWKSKKKERRERNFKLLGLSMIGMICGMGMGFMWLWPGTYSVDGLVSLWFSTGTAALIAGVLVDEYAKKTRKRQH